jgi:diphthine synthase
MLYLIGLGLDINSISKKGLEALKECNKIYLEDYTVEFPYTPKELQKSLKLGKKEIIPADRRFVESLDIVSEAKKENVALLIYGSPLTATTHISITEECAKKKIKFEIVYNASILDAVAETGLQLYKFGKIASMPKWDEKGSFRPTSFIELIKENQKINAHSLILVDIGLKFEDALREFMESADSEKFKLDKITVCSRMGLEDSRIVYGAMGDLQRIKEKPKAPFCFIIPGKMHFFEQEVLDSFSI